ncbi:AraC family transcriptional regulator [Streptomyces endophyticus]|uniref:AraC family transcriptional regulator n=1 Tax=Streptomyces endophyticus TaxID=714166 RepID=A0ABU6EXE8_9ACTN|nr:AraC family transcriptional regulator [Streptomyces endophyticus]MEB8336047.1 AraC family transcriptional regulator [Streptomyces endophyticus]
MKPRFESPGTPADTTWKCFIRREESFGFAWHHHTEYELTLITEGTGTRYIGTTVEPYRPGDLVLIGPDLPHTFSSAPYEGGMAEAAVAQFRGDFLGRDFLALPQFRAVAALLDRAATGLLFAPAPASVHRSLSGLPELGPTAATVELLAILDELTHAEQVHAFSSPGRAAAPSGDISRRIDKVCRHLEHAHTGPVTLPEVAALVHMAPTSFSRFFHRTMGRTFTDYVNQLRIETACHLLTDTDLPVTEAAARSGYQNLSNFNRRFQESRRIRPREYRAAHRGPSGTR